MKKFIFAALLVPFALNVSYGQHSDLEFGYDDQNNPTSILIESDLLTDEGIQVIEGGFETSLLGDAFADSPGFITSAAEGLLVNAGDQISVRILDGSTTAVGAGFVNFYDAATDQILSDNNTDTIEISNQGSVDVGTFGDSFSGDDVLLLSTGSDGTIFSNSPDAASVLLGVGEIHNHLVFDLLGSESVGAYGLLFQLEADFADANGNVDGTVDATSAPAWLLFNNGLDDDVFEDQALAAFGVSVASVPEPTSSVAFLMAAGAVLSRRRRRL